VPVGALLGVAADPAVAEADIDAFVQSYEVIVQDADDAAGPSPQTVDVAGQRINYIRMGSGGPAVLLIHGFGGDAAGWGFVQQALSSDYDTVALDLIGHGASDKQVKDGSLAGQANLVSAFLSTLDLDRVHVIGHSMGAGVALALALAQPQRVMSLSLIAPAGLGPDINVDYLHAFINSEKRRDVESVLNTLFEDSGIVNRDMVAEVQKYKRLDGVKDALHAIMEAFVANGQQRDILRDRLSELQKPVAIIWGTQDKIIPVAQAEGLEQVATVIRVENAGHMPHVENPTQVIQAISENMARAGHG
jgi:pyruvate dehydrogenase E2 component (dihydrolipoamide acetyltransferase)